MLSLLPVSLAMGGIEATQTSDSFVMLPFSDHSLLSGNLGNRSQNSGLDLFSVYLLIKIESLEGRSVLPSSFASLLFLEGTGPHGLRK